MKNYSFHQPKLPKVKLPKVKKLKLHQPKLPKLRFGGKRGRFDGSSGEGYYTKIFR